MDYIDQIIVFHVLIIISLSKEPKKKVIYLLFVKKIQKTINRTFLIPAAGPEKDMLQNNI